MSTLSQSQLNEGQINSTIGGARKSFVVMLLPPAIHVCGDTCGLREVGGGCGGIQELMCQCLISATTSTFSFPFSKYYCIALFIVGHNYTDMLLA